VFVLDSDILSIIQDRDGVDFRRIQQRMAAVDPTRVFVSVITFHEQANGWNNYIRRARNADHVVHGYAMYERMLAEFLRLNVLSFNHAAAKIFADLRSQKIRIGTMDLRIAAVALANDMAVVTRNTVDFQRVPGLRIEDWTLPLAP
jgi:tRNA(fMet)-specific endonuclease VapC